MSLQDDVRRTDDVPIVPVEHPEWKDAHVRPMSAWAFGEYLKKTDAYRETDDDPPIDETLHIMAFVTAHCLCDKAGVRVFSDDEVEHVELRAGGHDGVVGLFRAVAGGVP